MADPVTLQFGPWAPDLQNVPNQVPYSQAPFPVPLADCLNVYHQDGAYRSLPSLAAAGPSLGQQVFGAFTWYDDTANQEIVFAGTANGIYGLIDGVWTQVPLFISTVVTLSGNALSISQGNLKYLYGGTMVAGSGSIRVTGYDSTVPYGSLSPTTDSNGHTILAAVDNGNIPGANFLLVIGAASLGANYFSSITIQPLGVTLSATAATYSTSGGQSRWQWSGSIGINSGSTYQLALFA